MQQGTVATGNEMEAINLLNSTELVRSLDEEIIIEGNGCELVVTPKKLPGTEFQPATCDGAACVVMLMSYSDAVEICRTLVTYTHPNVLKPIGIWKSKDDKAYLAFDEVHGSLKKKGNGYIFSIEDSSIYGFSANGLKAFREIFSAVNYVNTQYKQDAESRHALKLVDSTIFYRTTAEDEVEAVLGVLYVKNPGPLANLKTKTRGSRGPTVEELERYNWTSTGDYIKGYFKGCVANDEIKHLVEFLKGASANYDDLHWEPGLWEADIKMQFIREIWWHVEQQRGSVKLIELRETEKGKVLNSIRRPLGIIECIRKLAEPEKAARIVEATLLDSVRHLRDSVVAHHGGSINAYQGAKEDVRDKVNLERLIQKAKGDYMIKLVREIRPLKWITESPVLRDQNNYMECFYEMKQAEEKKQKQQEQGKKHKGKPR
ncbi:uncharacterized protein LOC119305392 [Triticum dicoccoides]|uniref:uncharacterized protein LOC119305392 n=1 Tax=Triticum dicoccoides TaxID=85692 RepID=UPI001890880A|nr:uncharacterized protein LOC119305392 [Triticum dicoccoides]